DQPDDILAQAGGDGLRLDIRDEAVLVGLEDLGFDAATHRHSRSPLRVVSCREVPGRMESYRNYSGLSTKHKGRVAHGREIAKLALTWQSGAFACWAIRYCGSAASGSRPPGQPRLPDQRELHGPQGQAAHADGGGADGGAAAARDRPPGRYPRARSSQRGGPVRLALGVGEAARAR